MVLSFGHFGSQSCMGSFLSNPTLENNNNLWYPGVPPKFPVVVISKNDIGEVVRPFLKIKRSLKSTITHCYVF